MTVNIAMHNCFLTVKCLTCGNIHCDSDQSLFATSLAV